MKRHAIYAVILSILIIACAAVYISLWRTPTPRAPELTPEQVQEFEKQQEDREIMYQRPDITTGEA
jgi:hypothetical protein